MVTSVTRECLDDVQVAPHVGAITLLDKTVQCAVTDGGVRILSDRSSRALIGHAGKQKGAQKALENHAYHLPSFLGAANLKPYIPSGFSMPTIRYRHPVNNRVFDGYEATLLPSVCDVYLDARNAGVLRPHQLPIAAACEALVRALAKTGLMALIDEATGFQAKREPDALQRFFNAWLRREAMQYQETFIKEFYRQLFRLNGWKWDEGNPAHGPRCVARMTNDVVYSRLIPNLLPALENLNPLVEDDEGNRRRLRKHHQHLSTEIGRKQLHSHLELLGYPQKTVESESR